MKQNNGITVSLVNRKIMISRPITFKEIKKIMENSDLIGWEKYELVFLPTEDSINSSKSYPNFYTVTTTNDVL